MSELFQKYPQHFSSVITGTYNWRILPHIFILTIVNFSPSPNVRQRGMYHDHRHDNGLMDHNDLHILDFSKYIYTNMII